MASLKIGAAALSLELAQWRIPGLRIDPGQIKNPGQNDRGWKFAGFLNRYSIDACAGFSTMVGVTKISRSRVMTSFLSYPNR